jgi:hypothetical protein
MTHEGFRKLQETPELKEALLRARRRIEPLDPDEPRGATGYAEFSSPLPCSMISACL